MRPAPLEDVVDEVEQARVRPLEVLEEQNGHAAIGDPLEEGSPCREQLLALAGASLLHAEQLKQAGLDPAPLLRIGNILRDRRGDPLPGGRGVIGLGESRALTDHLAERPEGDALPVCGGSALVPVDVLDHTVDVLVELPSQAALADAGHAHERHEPRAPFPSGRVKQLLEDAHLGIASDEGRFESLAAVRAAAHGDDAVRAPGGDSQLLALEQLVAGRLEGDRHRCSAHRALVDEQGPGRCGGLQAGGGVDHVPGDHSLAGGADGDRGGARRDARAELEIGRVDLGSELTDRDDELEACTNGPLRVILVCRRRAEHRHDGVADELLDHAAVPVDDLARDVEVAGEQLAHVLGVTGLGQAREADQVGEEDRDEAPLRDVRRREIAVVRRRRRGDAVGP